MEDVKIVYLVSMEGKEIVVSMEFREHQDFEDLLEVLEHLAKPVKMVYLEEQDHLVFGYVDMLLKFAFH